MYTPPFTINAKSINLISDISAALERYKIQLEKEDAVRLRKINQMKTIHGSLAIEGNSLSEEQVTALIEGKNVVAPIKEVQEVRNAIKVYEQFRDFNPYDYNSLLKAHSIMALGLVDNPGHFRKSGVCVASKDGIAHIAPPAARVPFLMGELFEWLTKSEDHFLIKSSVFHYEFEFIHPFEDGNGRIGRLWQSLILSQWNAVFESLPIENMIWKNQAEYYQAIQLSTDNTNSGIFVEFMLSTILNSILSHKKIEKVVPNIVDDNINTDNDNLNAKNDNINATNDNLNDKNDNTNDNISVANDNLNNENDNINDNLNGNHDNINDNINSNNDNLNNENDNINDNTNDENDNLNADDDNITPSQKKIVEAIKKNPSITQTELSKIVEMTVANINRNMKRLQEKVIIKRIGANKNGHWEIL